MLPRPDLGDEASGNSSPRSAARQATSSRLIATHFSLRAPTFWKS